MARLEEWFDDWAESLRVRSGRADWPDVATDAGWEFWQDFRRALARCGAHQEEADEASSAVCDAPGLFVSQYRPMVVEAIKQIQARAAAGDQADPAGSLEAAKAASRDCPDCQGTGGAVRYVHADVLGRVKTSGGGVAPVGMAVAYPCSCPLGRLVAEGLRPPGQARTPLTVDEYPSLRMGRVAWSDRPDNRYRHRHSAWDEPRGMPLPVAIADVAGLREFVGSLAAESRAPRHPAPAPRPELAQAPPDPVIDRERAPRTTPTPAPALTIPEDDAANGWF